MYIKHHSMDKISSHSELGKMRKMSMLCYKSHLNLHVRRLEEIREGAVPYWGHLTIESEVDFRPLVLKYKCSVNRLSTFHQWEVLGPVLEPVLPSKLPQLYEL